MKDLLIQEHKRRLIRRYRHTMDRMLTLWTPELGMWENAIARSPRLRNQQRKAVALRAEIDAIDPTWSTREIFRPVIFRKKRKK